MKQGSFNEGQDKPPSLYVSRGAKRNGGVTEPNVRRGFGKKRGIIGSEFMHQWVEAGGMYVHGLGWALPLSCLLYIISVLVYTTYLLGCATCLGIYINGASLLVYPLLCAISIITALMPLEARSCPSH